MVKDKQDVAQLWFHVLTNKCAIQIIHKSSCMQRVCMPISNMFWSHPSNTYPIMHINIYVPMYAYILFKKSLIKFSKMKTCILLQNNLYLKSRFVNVMIRRQIQPTLRRQCPQNLNNG